LAFAYLAKSPQSLQKIACKSGGVLVIWQYGKLSKNEVRVLGEKVLEIVIYLMRHIEENGGRFEGIKEMADRLRTEGFTDSEINSAYFWIMDQYQQPEFMARFRSHPSVGYRRVFSDEERSYFTTEAQGELIQMRQLGIVNEAQLELIIQKVIMSIRDRIDAVAVRALAWSLISIRLAGDHSSLISAQ